MDPFFGAAALSAGAGLVSGLLGNKASREAEDRAYQRSIELQRMQNDFNVQMWNRTNEYNSPRNQVKLYKDAGINPALYSLGGGNSAASEVTASDASVPMNGDQGKIIQGIGDSIGQGASRIIQALQADAQIAKLRSDIKYQELLNRDFENQLKAKEALMPNVYESVPYQDETGSWVKEVYPHTNAYWEDRQHKRQDLVDKDLRNKFTQDELDVYEASMPYLKRMPENQLKSLLEDIRTKANNNTLLEGDVELLKRYGIGPNDDGFKALIRIALRNPDSFTRIIEGLGSAGASTFRGIFGSHTHRNPSIGSW